MAYNRKMFLKKVQKVNEVYLEYANKGISNKYIFENYIQDQFCISIATFYNYLTIPYVSELKQIELKTKTK